MCDAGFNYEEEDWTRQAEQWFILPYCKQTTSLCQHYPLYIQPLAQMSRASIHLSTLVLSKTILEISFDFHDFCDIFPLAKQSRLPFSNSTISSHAPFDLIDFDIWGPYKIQSHFGAHYFLTIVDDYTRYIWVTLMHYKSDTQSILRNFFAWIKTQHNHRIKAMRSDNGGEFLSLQTFFKVMAQIFNDLVLIHTSTKWGYRV